MKRGKVIWSVAFCVFTAASLPAGAAEAAAGRAVLSLDGTWQFRLDPDGAGREAKWFSADAAFGDTIQVPGAWQAQGYGAESDKLRHSYDGKAWYRREVAIPDDWAGRRVFLCIGGVHRYAEVWVNGVRLGEHIGYLSPFEFEITQVAPAGRTAVVVVCVDSRQRWDIDCLTGCFDIIDEMFTSWGGIWGHVSVEARPSAWLEDVFIRTPLSVQRCMVSARVAGDRATVDRMTLELFSRDGARIATWYASLAETVSADGQFSLGVVVPGASVWSPASPYLYRFRLSLYRGETVVDRVETRFGFRRIHFRGDEIYLNGKKIFLRGYGDDSVYPQTMAAPSDKELYLARLKLAREYGFNYVRHHSTILPPEYYEAADEAGMLVSAEFPIAYLSYYQRASGPALELYKSEWAAVIRRLRNHPCIFNWCMGNELWDSIPIASDLYRLARDLDSSRPVIDSDGLRIPPFVRGPGDRATLDFFPALFDEWSLPLDAPGKYAFDTVPKKPVLSHETGNYATFPRLGQIAQFKDNFKPFWLTNARARLEKLGLLGEADLWSRNSERLYLLSHKLNVEAIRRNPHISGYMWWLIQDYWTGSNGLVDAYFRPKEIDPAAVRKFNADVVLLQDELPVTCRGGQTLRVPLLVSNYSQTAIDRGRLRWQLKTADRVLAAGGPLPVQVGQGEVKQLTEVRAELPSAAEPQQVTLVAELEAGGTQYRNDWYTWLYPAEIGRPRLNVPLFASGDLLDSLGPLGAKAIPQAALPASAVYVVSRPDSALLDALEAGASLLCLSPQGVFPTVRNRFKPAWWLGSDEDCNVGTVVYDNPATRAMAPEGWCDAGWYHLLEGADAYVLDAFPAAPHVLVRGLDIHSRCRSKALLFEARVGKGSLIVCGLRVISANAAARPEARWLLARLVEYAAAPPAPSAQLPVEFLRERIARSPMSEPSTRPEAAR